MSVANDMAGWVAPTGADLAGTVDLNVCTAELGGPVLDPEDPPESGGTEWGDQITWACPERGRLYVDDAHECWWARDLVAPGGVLGEGTPEPVSLAFDALPALVLAARAVVSRWAGGDLAAAVRELDEALAAFGDPPPRPSVARGEAGR